MDVIAPSKESILESLRTSVEAVKNERIACEKLETLREQTRVAEEEWRLAYDRAKSAALEWGKTVSIAKLSDLDELLGKWFDFL